MILDVREQLKQGGRPMKRIMDAVRGLPRDEDLVLLATFEPVPLYAMMRLRGFRHEVRRLPAGDWEVRFHRGAQPPAPAAGAQGEAEPPPEGGAEYVRLDNRGLEPPEPMMRTLEALSALPERSVLEIHNDRAPQFLYPHLRERGYRFHTAEQPDGSALVRIWRGA